MIYIFSDIVNDFSHIISITIVIFALFISYQKRFLFIFPNYSLIIYSCPFVTIILFILSVLAVWHSADSSHVAISAFLPWNDANGYFHCAHNFLDRGEISDFCQRRPIYSLFLASLLGLAGRDLQIVLIIQAILLGSAVYLFSRQLERSLGIAAALIIFSFLFLFSVETSNTTLTENTGFLFGLLGLTYLWNGAKRNSLFSISVGTLLLTLALNARSGAYFVLPAIIVWSMLFILNKRRKKAITALIVLSAICAGFLVNSGLLMVLGGEQKMNNANFSYVIYGVTAGGKGWRHVYEAEPEIFSEGGGEVITSQKIYKAALNNLIDKPNLFISAYYLGFKNYFDKIIRFVRVKPYRISVLWIFFTVLWFVGLSTAVLNIRRDRGYSLIAFLAMGVILSAPFITFDGRSRIYAATLPIDSVMIGIGFVTIRKYFSQLYFSSSSFEDRIQRTNLFWINIFTAIIVVILLPGPWIVKSWAALPALPDEQCTDEFESIILRPGLESPMLGIIGTEKNTNLYPLRVPLINFRKGLNDRSIYLYKEFAALPEETYLLWGYQRSEKEYGKQSMIIWPNMKQIIEKGDVVHLCVKLNANEYLPGFANVESSKILKRY